MTPTGKEFYSAGQWNEWLEQLSRNDFLVVDNFISDKMYRNIQTYFDALLEQREFSKAAIGSAEKRQVESSIRGDFIYWLDPEKDREMSDFFALADEVMLNIRQQLFLSLSDYEFHFALYPPETKYEKHVDQFRGQDNRVISLLIYLNEDWETGDGGELKIYQQEDNDLIVEPLARRLLMFKSDTVEHEVLQTNTHRRSLTGWLLHRPAAINSLI